MNVDQSIDVIYICRGSNHVRFFKCKMGMKLIQVNVIFIVFLMIILSKDYECNFLHYDSEQPRNMFGKLGKEINKKYPDIQIQYCQVCQLHGFPKDL